MDNGIADASDWLDTALTPFSALETALRCQVCKDFYATPMVTSCSHTFCSICIRRCLSSDGKCPACRANDQASKLRRNWAIEEVVGAFKAARPSALELATRDRREAEEAQNRPAKRRKVDRHSGGDELPMRTTRSQSKRQTQPDQTAAVQIDDDDDDDDEYKPHAEAEALADDGLVACPICNKRMKEEVVFPHLGSPSCLPEKATRPPSNPLSRSSRPASTTPKPIPDRLAELNYSLLNEKALRKKLLELGLPATGTKTLLSRRHTEWVNLWNANVDAGAPRSKRELLDELRKWDRAMGREPDISMPANQVMKKDFDADAWKTGNKSEFDRLIAQARQGRKKKPDQEEGQESNLPGPSPQSREIQRQQDSDPPSLASPETDLPSGYHDATEAQESADELAHPPPSAQQQSIPLRNDTSLPEHFVAPDRSVDMFEMPSQPVRDVDMQEAGGR